MVSFKGSLSILALIATLNSTISPSFAMDEASDASPRQIVSKQQHVETQTEGVQQASLHTLPDDILIKIAGNDPRLINTLYQVHPQLREALDHLMVSENKKYGYQAWSCWPSEVKVSPTKVFVLNNALEHLMESLQTHVQSVFKPSPITGIERVVHSRNITTFFDLLPTGEIKDYFMTLRGLLNLRQAACTPAAAPTTSLPDLSPALEEKLIIEADFGSKIASGLLFLCQPAQTLMVDLQRYELMAARAWDSFQENSLNSAFKTLAALNSPSPQVSYENFAIATGEDNPARVGGWITGLLRETPSAFISSLPEIPATRWSRSKSAQMFRNYAHLQQARWANDEYRRASSLLADPYEAPLHWFAQKNQERRTAGSQIEDHLLAEFYTHYLTRAEKMKDLVTEEDYREASTVFDRLGETQKAQEYFKKAEILNPST